MQSLPKVRQSVISTVELAPGVDMCMYRLKAFEVQRGTGKESNTVLKLLVVKCLQTEICFSLLGHDVLWVSRGKTDM
jgi:hypothetical protein